MSVHRDGDPREKLHKTQDFLRLIGVPVLPPRTSPFDPGYDPVTVEANGQQASACCVDEDTSFATLQATLSATGRALAAHALRQAI